VQLQARGGNAGGGGEPDPQAENRLCATMVCSSRVRQRKGVDNAADGDERTSLLLRSSTSTKRQRLEAAQSFHEKERFSAGQKPW
jgi:hypothetical protein